MTEQYAGALLYLVPVIVAAIVAFVVTRPEKSTADDEPVAEPMPSSFRRIPLQRPAPITYASPSRRAVPPPQSPTLLHAALSSHLAAVSGASGASGAAAPLSARQPVIRPARLVSIRRPARIPRRPLHKCPHKP